MRIDQNKDAILKPNKGLATSLGNTHSNSIGERMNFNLGVKEMYYPLPITG